jgi:ribosomal protein L29
MADKKTTKKTVTNSLAELRAKTVAELEKLLQTARGDLLESQKSLRANELANPHVVTKMRKEIARVMTVLTEKRKLEQANNQAKAEEK